MASSLAAPSSQPGTLRPIGSYPNARWRCGRAMSAGRLPPPRAAGSAGAALGLRLPAAPRAIRLPGLSSSSSWAPLLRQERQQLQPLAFSRRPPSRLHAAAPPWRQSGREEEEDEEQQLPPHTLQQQPWTWQAALQRLRLPRAILPWDKWCAPACLQCPAVLPLPACCARLALGQRSAGLELPPPASCTPPAAQLPGMERGGHRGGGPQRLSHPLGGGLPAARGAVPLGQPLGGC